MGNQCKLCLSKEADKRNSHIVPKFITKSILESPDSSRRAHTINTAKPLEEKYSQDSPKEHHILCTECEKYFEIMETYISEHLHKRIFNEKFSADFEYKGGENREVKYAIANQLHPSIAKLFVYSIFWRSSISSELLYEDFKLQAGEEEFLRRTLLMFKTADISLLKLMPISPGPPYVVLRHEASENKDNSKNVIYANAGNEDIYQIIANDYMFFLAFAPGSIDNFAHLVNNGTQKLSVGILEDPTWINLRDGLFAHAAKIANRNKE